MILTKPDGLKKNKILDLVSLVWVGGVLFLTPVIVSMYHVVPAKGPDRNPTILIMFLVFLGMIVALSLVAVAGMAMRRTQSTKLKEGLTPFGINLFNVLGKSVAGLFLISGFVKLQDPIGFGYKLDDYWDFFSKVVSFFPSETMKAFSVPIAAFVSIFEVALGFALITGYRMRVTAWLLLLLLLFFTFLTGLAAFTGELQDCGCFGDALKLEPIQTFGKDVLLLIPGVVIWLNRRRIHPYYRRPVPASASLGSFLAGAAVSFYCHQHLELLDFRGAYKVGQDLCFNSTHAGEDGEIYAHDFSPFGMECSLDDCKGTMLYIVMYDMEQHPLEHFNAAGALAAEIKAKAPGIKVAGGSSTGTSVRKRMGLKFPDDFCWSGQDQKALRTMIRSSPGFIFLQDGIVKKKWHYHDMPTVDQLIKMAGANLAIPPAQSQATDSVVSPSAPHP
jgi:uncharacterized membrane protein YphA (DoxX/SURF4 family)